MKNIFLDVDETLVCSATHKHLAHAVEIEGMEGYFTVERPCAKRLINLCRELAGHSFVFLLSTGEREYLHCLNRMLDWEFDENNVFGREDLEKSRRIWPTAYGGRHVEVDPTIFAHPDNVLIDNVRIRHNDLKIAFIGIGKTFRENYLKVPDYCGSLKKEWDDDFFNRVAAFLENRH